MTGIIRRVLLLSLALISSLAFAPALAQDNPPPKAITIECASGVSSQVLGMSPVGDGSQTMILARVIFAPGGSLGAHTHPGTVVATVESGSFAFTHLGDGEMNVNRAATATTEATSEPLPHGEEVILAPGDWFVETGMIHSAKNLSDGPTTVVLTGLITTGQPLTICSADGATPASGHHG